MDNIKDELETMLRSYNHLFDIEAVEKLTIKFSPQDVFASTDIEIIDFEPQTDEQRRLLLQKLN